MDKQDAAAVSPKAQVGNDEAPAERDDSMVPARKQWLSPEWRAIPAREAELGFTTASADGTFNHS